MKSNLRIARLRNESGAIGDPPGSRYKKLVLSTHSAKEFLKQNRREKIFEAFLRARKSGLKEFKASDRVQITRVPGGNLNKGAWKIEVGKDSFFVKETDPRLVGKQNPKSKMIVRPADLGPRQFLALRRLKALKAMAAQFPHIEIADEHLAYQDPEKSFIVTTYYDKVKKFDVRKIPFKLYKEFNSFVTRAAEQKIGDLDNFNAFYDSKNNKIIIFDPRWLKGDEK